MLAQRDAVITSTSFHPDSELGLSTVWTVIKKKVVAYYCWDLVYEDRTEKRQMKEKYAEGVVQVTAETFQKPANEFSEDATGAEEIMHWVCIGSAQF